MEAHRRGHGRVRSSHVDAHDGAAARGRSQVDQRCPDDGFRGRVGDGQVPREACEDVARIGG